MSPEPEKDSVNLVSGTSSAVLRTLHIVEIVQEILESLCPQTMNLSEYRAFVSTRKIFLHTALTCRTLLEPSLDILWRYMHSIYPLLKLLPSEDFQQSNGEYVLSALTADSTSSHWHRIEYYGRRTKAFYHDPNSLPTIALASHTCNAIPYYFPSPLLPNIDSLYIGSFNPASDAVLFTMIPASFRHVEICNIQAQNKNFVDSLLVCLRAKSYDIQHLTFGGTFPSRFLQLAEYITSLTTLDLTQLVLDESVLQPAMRKVAKLPLLKTLMLDLGGGTGPRLPETVWSAPIGRLALKGNVSQISAFLNNHKMAHIRDIQLEFPSSYSVDLTLAVPEDWTTFMQILSLVVSCWSDTLQGIALGIERFLNFSVTLGVGAFPRIIESLMVLTQLKHLRIAPERHPASFPGLATANYWKMARAFPSLEDLALPQGNVMTFDALYKVALLCPRLRSLTVEIDTQTLPSLPSTQYPAIATNLQVLSVGNSPLNNIHSVTRHLNQLFPQLTTIFTTNTAWNTVQDLLKLYRSMVADSSHRREVTPALIEELGHAVDLPSAVTGTST